MVDSQKIASVSPDQTLTSFLCHAVAANRAEQKTLTLVVPGTVALQPDFFCALAEEWRTLRTKLGIGETTRIRIDCCHNETQFGWLPKLLERIELFRCRRAFEKRQVDQWISLTQCLVIGRPVDGEDAIVMGVADEGTRLPHWVKPAKMRMPQAQRATA